MNRILLSFIFVFALVSFAFAETEKFTFDLASADLYKCTTPEFSFKSCSRVYVPNSDKHVIELVRQGYSEGGELFSGEFSKNYTDGPIPYKIKIIFSKLVYDAKNWIYTLQASAEGSQNAEGQLELYWNNKSIEALLPDQVNLLSAPSYKNDVYYRVSLIITPPFK